MCSRAQPHVPLALPRSHRAPPFACPRRPAIQPPAPGLLARCLQGSDYSSIKAAGTRSREGALSDTSQPGCHGERRFHPGPHPGIMRCPCRDEGTEMSGDGDMENMALVCSMGSWRSSLKCHFRLGQAEELCKHLVQAMGKVFLGYSQPSGHHLHKASLPQGHLCTGNPFLQGLCPVAPCMRHPFPQGFVPGVPCMGHPFPQGFVSGVPCRGHPLPWGLCLGAPCTLMV